MRCKVETDTLRGCGLSHGRESGIWVWYGAIILWKGIQNSPNKWDFNCIVCTSTWTPCNTRLQGYCPLELYPWPSHCEHVCKSEGDTLLPALASLEPLQQLFYTHLTARYIVQCRIYMHILSRPSSVCSCSLEVLTRMPTQRTLLRLWRYAQSRSSPCTSLQAHHGKLCLPVTTN